MQYSFTKNLFFCAIIFGFFLFEGKFVLFAVKKTLDILSVKEYDKQALDDQEDDTDMTAAVAFILNKVMYDNGGNKSSKY